MARLGKARRLAARFSLVDDVAARADLLEAQYRDLNQQVATLRHDLKELLEAHRAAVGETAERFDATNRRLDVVADEILRRMEGELADLRRDVGQSPGVTGRAPE